MSTRAIAPVSNVLVPGVAGQITDIWAVQAVYNEINSA